MTQVDRRTAMKWVLAAGAAAQLPDFAFAAASAQGYGKDPNVMKAYTPGEAWPLTLNESQRRATFILCDLIIPADEHSPAASTVAVHQFIDEWISAPYPDCQRDRELIVPGLALLDAVSQRRFSRGFADAAPDKQRLMCDDFTAPAPPANLADAAAFFRRFRELTSIGYYTTPVGMKDIGYTGNEPLVAFAGPPPEVLKRLGLD